MRACSRRPLPIFFTHTRPALGPRPTRPQHKHNRARVTGRRPSHVPVTSRPMRSTLNLAPESSPEISTLDRLGTQVRAHCGSFNVHTHPSRQVGAHRGVRRLVLTPTVSPTESRSSARTKHDPSTTHTRTRIPTHVRAHRGVQRLVWRPGTAKARPKHYPQPEL